MTAEQWAQLAAAVAGALTALAAYLQSRKASAAAEQAGQKAHDAKYAAENGVNERTALRERAERAEQELAAITLQRDTFRDIVKYVRSRPEAGPLLRDYADRRQVVARDPALDALLAPMSAAPAPADLRPWLAAGALTLATIGAAVAALRRLRP